MPSCCAKRAYCCTTKQPCCRSASIETGA
jgi:hypothetical protein